MVEADDVAALQLVGQCSGQRLGGDGDGDHAVRDPIEGKVRGQRDAADLFRQEIVTGVQVGCSISACHILHPAGNAVGQVEAAHFHKLKVLCGDEGAARHGSLHADDLTGAAGPARDGRDGDECDDGSEHDAQDAVDESVVHFHGYSLLICVGLRTGMFYTAGGFRPRLPQGGAAAPRQQVI